MECSDGEHEQKKRINERTETEWHPNDEDGDDKNARSIADCATSTVPPEICEKKITTNEMKINEKFLFFSSFTWCFRFFCV